MSNECLRGEAELKKERPPKTDKTEPFLSWWQTILFHVNLRLHFTNSAFIPLMLLQVCGPGSWRPCPGVWRWCWWRGWGCGAPRRTGGRLWWRPPGWGAGWGHHLGEVRRGEVCTWVLWMARLVRWGLRVMGNVARLELEQTTDSNWLSHSQPAHI